MSSVEHPSSDETTVFVSYSRVDQEKALPIINMIKDAGYSVWWDGMLEAGERYLERTEHALETARAVVVIWSEQSVNSDWVRDEAMSGRDRKCLVPISLDGTMPPLGYRQIQAINFADWSGQSGSPRAEEVLRTIAAFHDGPAPPRRAPERLSPPLQPARASRRSVLLGGGAAAAAALLGIGWLATRTPPPAANRDNGLVVLPFENLSSEAENTILASTLDTEVRKRLTRNPALKVVGRTSSRAVQREGLSSSDICERLGISYVLEGTLLFTNNLVQISTSLVDGLTGIIRWTDDFEGAPEDILRFQDEIAAAVSANVTNQLANPDKRYGDATNAAAYQEYLTGRRVFRDAEGTSDLDIALGHFDRAIELDPNFAAAHAIKARLFVYRASISSNIDAADEARSLAVDSARKAIEIAPDSDDAHSTLGYVNFAARLDMAAAKTPFETSRTLGAGDAVILTRYAEFAASNGWDKEAMAAIERATELDPLNPSLFGRAGFIHYLAGRFDSAIDAFNRAETLRPSNFHRPSEIGLSHYYRGETELALSACDLEENGMDKLPCQAIAFRALGKIAEAQAAAASLIDEYGDAGLYQQAQVLAQSGEFEACQAILERAYDLKDSGMIMVRMDPALKPMHGRPDFEQLLARMGFGV